MKGGRLFAWRWGRGPDVVILPGIVDALLSWRAMSWVMSRLWRGAAARYRLTLLSAREAVPPGFTTEQMAQDVAEAVAALGREVRLTVGMDAGGLVAQWLASRWPERAGALVLLSSPLSGRVPEALAQFLDHLTLLLRSGSWPEAFDHAAAVYLDPELRRRLRLPLSLLRRWGRPADLQRGVRILAAFRTHDARTAPGPVKVPVLTVCGGLDQLIDRPLAGSPPTRNRSTSAWVRPARQVWLAGEHGAFLSFWHTVLEEVRRFERDASPQSGAARP